MSYSGLSGKGAGCSAAFPSAIMEFIEPGVVVIRPAGARGVMLASVIASTILTIQLIVFWLVFKDTPAQRMPHGMSPQLLWGILGGLLLLDIILFVNAVSAWKGKLGRKFVVIHRGVGLIWEQRRGPYEPSNEAIRFRDVAELEIVPSFIASNPPVAAFGLNLVFSRPPGERMKLIDCGDKEALRADAKQLAALVGVPLQDRSY